MIKYCDSLNERKNIIKILKRFLDAVLSGVLKNLKKSNLITQYDTKTEKL